MESAGIITAVLSFPASSHRFHLPHAAAWEAPSISPVSDSHSFCNYHEEGHPLSHPLHFRSHTDNARTQSLFAPFLSVMRAVSRPKRCPLMSVILLTSDIMAATAAGTFSGQAVQWKYAYSMIKQRHSHLVLFLLSSFYCRFRNAGS